MKHKDYVSASRKILGVNPTYEPMADWGNLAAIDRDYGHAPTLEAFQNWCLENRGVVTRYVISSFCRQAEGIISGIISVGPNRELDDLSSDLYEMAGVAFTGKERTGLDALMKVYTAEEIKKAYQEFTDALDNYKTARAPKDFIEGGATSVLLAIKKRNEASKVDPEAATRQAQYEIQVTSSIPPLPSNEKPSVSEAPAPDDLSELNS